jgi:hypothetical protein
MLSFQSIPIAVAVAVAVTAYVAYVACRQIVKAARPDIRSQVREEQESLRAAIEALSARLDFEKQSRTAAAEAAGCLDSEEFRQWLNDLDIDSLEVKHLGLQVPAADTDYKDLSDMELDIRLLEILALSLRANCLAEKYRAWLPADDRNRERPIDQAGPIDQTGPVSEPVAVLLGH